MATARMAAGGVLGVITDVTNTISTTSNTISNSVAILNDMVDNLRTRRQKADVVNMKSYERNLLQDAATDQVKREEAIRMYIGEDKEKQKSYNEFYTELQKALEDHEKAD